MRAGSYKKCMASKALFNHKVAIIIVLLLTLKHGKENSR